MTDNFLLKLTCDKKFNDGPKRRTLVIKFVTETQNDGHAASLNIYNSLFQGFHDIDEEVFLSVPCVLGLDGVTSVVQQKLTEDERSLLLTSAKTMHQVQANLKF